MYIYKCPIIGDGSVQDSFRPAIADYEEIQKWEFYGEIPIELHTGDIVLVKSFIELIPPLKDNIYLVEN